METIGIESLEPRVAPASISVVYADADGDLVKITASRAGVAVPPLTANNLVFTDGDPDGQLQTLTLTDPTFADVSITVTVTKKPGGDGLANVGFIDATGVDLKKVTVKGDLGRILVGDLNTVDDPGLELLAVRSLGEKGLVTQNGTGDLNTVVKGMLGALKVTKNLVNATVSATGNIAGDGDIGSVYIGGDLVGTAGSGAGKVTSSGTMGNVRIVGGVQGVGSGFSGGIVSNAGMGAVTIGQDLAAGIIASTGPMGAVRIGGDVAGGAVQANAGIESVWIKGSLIGAAGASTGRIISQDTIGKVFIGGDVTTGEGLDSGEILSYYLLDRVQIRGDLTGTVECLFGAIGEVRVGGDVIGTKSGAGLISGGTIERILIGGNLTGGSISGTESLLDSGTIIGGTIRNVSIKGSIIAGTDESTGSILRSAGIYAGRTIGLVKIGGGLLGNETSAALIIATGQEVKPVTGFDLTIGSVSVAGDVKFARILAGFDQLEGPANADASIGKIVVGKKWVASSVVAGAQDYGTAGYGIGDALQSVGDTLLIARIESITIKGGVTGTTATGDHFGFVAQQIDKFILGTRPLTLSAGPSNDDVAIPSTDDVRLLEVSA